MKIAIISYHTSPIAQPGVGDAGGMNVYLWKMAQALCQLEVEIDIFTRSQTNKIELYSAQNRADFPLGLRVIALPVGQGLNKTKLDKYLVVYYQQLKEKFQLAEYDLVHSHYWLSGIIAQKIAADFRLSWVHTGHTWGAVKASFGEKESAYRLSAEAELSRQTDLIVANTEIEKAEIEKVLPAGIAPVEVVYPGVDLNIFYPRDKKSARQKFVLALEGKILLFVGRLQSFKGPDLLLKVAQQLRQIEPELDFSLVICGGNSQSYVPDLDLESLAAELGIKDRVKFLDPLPAEELAILYAASDIVLVPSKNESFGLVALEAIACGIPVMAHDTGGLAIAVGRGGVLLPDLQLNTWVQALEQLLPKENELKQLGQVGVEYAQNFSWDKSAQKLEKVYRKISAIADKEGN